MSHHSASVGIMAPILTSSPDFPADANLTLETEHKPLKDANGEIASPFAPVASREPQDTLFRNPFLVLSAIGLLLSLREATIFLPILFRYVGPLSALATSLSLLPALALAAFLGTLACVLLLWLGQGATAKWLKRSLVFLAVLMALELLLLLGGLLALMHLSPPTASTLSFPITMASLRSALLGIVSVMVLVVAVHFGGFVFASCYPRPLSSSATIIAHASKFLLGRGRKITLLTIAAFSATAVLLLPALTLSLRGLDACAHVQQTGVSWQPGGAASDHASNYPDSSSSTFGSPVDDDHSNPFAPDEFNSDSGGKLPSEPVAPGDIQLCQALTTAAMDASPLTVSLRILFTVSLFWMGAVFWIMVKFLASFWVSEAFAKANGLGSLEPSTTLQALRLCVWESGGTLTRAAIFLVAILAVVLAVALGIFATGLQVAACVWLVFGLITYIIASFFVNNIVVPLVALRGCSLKAAIKAGSLFLQKNAKQALILFLSALAFHALLALVVALCMLIPQVFSITIADMAYGLVYKGGTLALVNLVVTEGAAVLQLLFSTVWVTTFWSTYTNADAYGLSMDSTGFTLPICSKFGPVQGI